ncbi:FkbM family methyltransferase [Thiogranum longum]|uniref:FkbM family methyltransferase n=1 Tax=Thiogranum longum TaxID=1537524 RepID=A0A4R1H8H3_9GAMM|nr:FkbM family methyltransferase [Thiogranum longum]TCK18137.1 FkbM family methyltransferase [Thiogranum longum]
MNLFDKLHMQLRFRRYRRRKEAEEIRFMQSLPLSGQTVIDIGANKGVYSYWMSRAVGPEGRVIAFEPQPELEKHLQDVMAGFSLSNVELVTRALSAQPGDTPLYRRSAGAGDASFEAMPDTEAISVPCTTLDVFAAESGLGKVAYIKCDVEGHELAVMQGAEQLLKSTSPVLQVECHHREAGQGKLFDFLSGLGYEGFFLHDGRRIACREFNRYPCRKVTTDHRNYLFVRTVPRTTETNPGG